MTNQTNSLDYTTEPMPTSNTWQYYMENEVGGIPALRYVDSTIHMLQKIEAIVKIQSFDEMKNELTALYHERLTFVQHAINHLP